MIPFTQNLTHSRHVFDS